MNARTVDWAALRTQQSDAESAEGLRERKKRHMRQQLTDVATEMFVERGFDNVSVSDIAAACGVSQKTVFNYFPTKESLILDLPQATLAALRTALSDRGHTPTEAVLGILAGELGSLILWFDAQPDRAEAVRRYQRFGALIHSTPALRAYQREMTEQLTTVAAGILAERAGMQPGDPEPAIAAVALLALWPIQFRSLGRHLDSARTSKRLHAAVTADVQRAARLLDAGLHTWRLDHTRTRAATRPPRSIASIAPSAPRLK